MTSRESTGDVRAVALRLVVPSGVAVAMWLVGWRWQAVAVLVVAVVVASVRPVGRRVERGVARVADAAARAATTVVLAIAWVTVVLPVALWCRIRRRNPLGSTSAPPAWRRVGSGGPGDARRQFATGPRPALRRSGRLQRAWTAVGVVAVLLVVDVAGGVAVGRALGWPAPNSSAQMGIDVAAAGGPTTTVPPYDPATSPWPPDVVPNWINQLEAIDKFADVPWAPEYFYAMEQRAWTPYPYLGTKPVPLATRYVNQSGWERRTYRQPGVAADAPVVWMFGGSTTWGVGQRDQHTIPSELARLAEAEGTAVTVRNFGQPTWLNWQEMLLFELLLAEETRTPDVVVFYDGVNEFASPPPYDHPSPRSFDSSDVSSLVGAGPLARPNPFAEVIRWYRDRSLGVRVWRSVSDALGVPSAGAQPASDWTEADEVRATARNYDRGVAIVEELAGRRGIETVFFWQPRLGGRERHDAIREAVTSDVVDISDALDGSPDVYYDDHHTDELGARIVAERIWPHLRPLVESAGR